MIGLVTCSLWEVLLAQLLFFGSLDEVNYSTLAEGLNKVIERRNVQGMKEWCNAMLSTAREAVTSERGRLSCRMERCAAISTTEVLHH